MEQSNAAWKKIKNFLKLVWDLLAMPPWSRKQQPPLYCYDMKIYFENWTSCFLKKLDIIEKKEGEAWAPKISQGLISPLTKHTMY